MYKRQEEHVVWDESEVEGYGQFIWAPELHKIGDYWYFISTAAVGEGGYSFDIRPFMMRCNDADNITDPDSWGEPERVKPAEGDTSCLQVMSLDMTYFEAGGKCYVSWADKTQENLSKVFIATVDPEDPTQLTSKADVYKRQDVFDVSVNADESTPDGSWTRLVKRDGQSEAGFSRGEGLTVYQLPAGTWCAMADNGGYTAYLTDDLSSGTFTPVSYTHLVYKE